MTSEHTPLTDAELEAYLKPIEAGESCMHIAGQRAMRDLREARRLLRAFMDDSISEDCGLKRCKNPDCLAMRYLAACEGKS